MSWVAWLEEHMLTCPSKKVMVIDCPGCGLQRSVICLLKGDIQASWDVYPPGMFVIATLLLLGLHLLFGFKHGALMLKIFFILTISVMVINYIYKITNHQLL